MENIYQLSKYIGQIFVTGDSYHSFLVAVIVPRHDTMKKWAEEKGIPVNHEELCKNEEFKLEILRDLCDIGVKNKRNGIEIIKNAYLTTTEFTIENNMMTPSQKIKRFEARKMYDNEIKQLYDKPPLNVKRPKE